MLALARPCAPDMPDISGISGEAASLLPEDWPLCECCPFYHGVFVKSFFTAKIFCTYAMN
jgi:hypothetical protein